jgi:hypothetical protein
MPYGLSSCASNSSLRLSGLPSRRLYGCGVIAVSFIELDSVNVLGVAGGAVRRRKERDQEFVPGSSGRTDQYAGLEYASPPVPDRLPGPLRTGTGRFPPEGRPHSAKCSCVKLIAQGSWHRSACALQAARAGSTPAWAP